MSNPINNADDRELARLMRIVIETKGDNRINKQEENEG